MRGTFFVVQHDVTNTVIGHISIETFIKLINYLLKWFRTKPEITLLNLRECIVRTFVVLRTVTLDIMPPGKGGRGKKYFPLATPACR